MPLRRAPAGRGIFHLIFAAAAATTLVLCAPDAHANQTRPGLNHDGSPHGLAVWRGAAPPPFHLRDIDNAAVSLADARGDVVIVHFFATWCEPCREELPALHRLVERSDPARLQVISISVAEVGARVRRFIETLPVGFPVLLDGDRAIAKAWKVSSLPTSIILDRDLNPRLLVERDYDWDQVDVSQLLRLIER